MKSSCDFKLTYKQIERLKDDIDDYFDDNSLSSIDLNELDLIVTRMMIIDIIYTITLSYQNINTNNHEL